MVGKRSQRPYGLLCCAWQHRRSSYISDPGDQVLVQGASASEPASPPQLDPDEPSGNPVVTACPCEASFPKCTLRRSYSRQEPSAVVPHAGICAGGRSKGWSLPQSKRQRSLIHGAIGVIALIIVPLAVSVHSALSWAFALTSRPGWMETIFPPYFVIAALYSGTALVIIVASAFRKGYHLERFITERHLQRLSYIMVALGLVYLYLTLADFLSEGYTGISTGWIYQTVVGRYSIPFWFYVIAGELVPMVLVALKKTRNIKGITIAAVGVVIALWVKRIVIVLPPATQPLIGGQWGTYHFTAVSILVTLAGVVAIPLGLMLLFRILPVLSIDEMIQADPVGSFERISQQSLEMVRLTAPGTHANGKHPDEQESEVSK